MKTKQFKVISGNKDAEIFFVSQTWLLKFTSKNFSSECSTYSRIQGRHPKCSKRTSFIGNTSWPDSPKPMKIYVNIGLNRLFTWHTRLRYMVLFTVSYFLLKILRIPDNDRKKNLQFFYSFYSQETHRDATTEL